MTCPRSYDELLAKPLPRACKHCPVTRGETPREQWISTGDAARETGAYEQATLQMAARNSEIFCRSPRVAWGAYEIPLCAVGAWRAWMREMRRSPKPHLSVEAKFEKEMLRLLAPEIGA